MNHQVNNILTSRDKLHAIEEQTADSHIVAVLLCSLPHAYDSLITALESRCERDLTVAFVKNKFIDEFSHHFENRNVSLNSRDAAYKAVNKSNKKRKSAVIISAKILLDTSVTI